MDLPNEPIQHSNEPFTAFYPELTLTLIKNPNQLFAIPFFGGLIKFFMLIPVGVVLVGYTIIVAVLLLINSFVVLVRGSYWPIAYYYLLQYMAYSTKSFFYFYGLTDRYPGFSAALPSEITLAMPMPAKPNRVYAIPVLGGLIRILLLIPYCVFQYILNYAALIGVLGSSLVVLFDGRYPESTYELARDERRVSLALTAYMAGLSDRYPSFSISWQHKGIKVFLIILAILFIVIRLINSAASNQRQPRWQQNDMQVQSPSQNYFGSSFGSSTN